MDHADHRNELPRLRRIEGQVGGISRMVEQGRYCVDILTQMRAVRAALAKVEQRVLRDHIEHCVAAAIRDGDRSRQEVKMDELFEVLSRFTG
mgnify:CR=1 FL=1